MRGRETPDPTESKPRANGQIQKPESLASDDSPQLLETLEAVNKDGRSDRDLSSYGSVHHQLENGEAISCGNFAGAGESLLATIADAPI